MKKLKQLICKISIFALLLLPFVASASPSWTVFEYRLMNGGGYKYGIKADGIKIKLGLNNRKKGMKVASQMNENDNSSTSSWESGGSSGNGSWKTQKDPMGGKFWRVKNKKTGETLPIKYKSKKQAKKAAKILNKGDKSVMLGPDGEGDYKGGGMIPSRMPPLSPNKE